MAWGSNVNTIDRSIGVYQGNPEIGKFGAEERKRKYYGDVSKALRGINETVDGKSDEELQAMKADLMKQLEEIKAMPIDQPIQEPIAQQPKPQIKKGATNPILGQADMNKSLMPSNIAQPFANQASLFGNVPQVPNMDLNQNLLPLNMQSKYNNTTPLFGR